MARVIQQIYVQEDTPFTMQKGAMDRMLLACVRGQVERLDRIDTLLKGDLSTEEAHREITQQLAQFGDYEEGESVQVFTANVQVAQGFARRVLPGCQLGLLAEHGEHRAVFVDPPPDERLTEIERKTTIRAEVWPVACGNAEAVALLRAVAHVMRMILRSDLAKYEAAVAGAEDRP
ncbi:MULTISPECIES: hypothetical protein [unclassified Methylobacterium]|jgi:hypothetical protein|uniref:hypothetical protein n=1 Tax=unclassified Methylobacterium TaxID=2615210 RepID=UPI001354D0BA|nr:hypothetical protein [Methylobacterium sp. 2A]MWV22418.1 hypothetical protein [Methylobacterium sp. 2A]